MNIKKSICLTAILSITACATKKKQEDVYWWQTCQPINAIIGEVSVSHKYNVATVEKIYKQTTDLPECKNGIYGQGIADIVAKSLATDFAKMVVYLAANEELGDFVFKNINATADWSDLDKIVANSKLNCPKENQKICHKLEHLSSEASQQAKRIEE